MMKDAEMTDKILVLFPSLKSALATINLKRAERGVATIDDADWSSFLSGANGSSVKKLWLKTLLDGKPIPQGKALSVFSGVNAALKQVSADTLKANVLVPDASNS